jgi:hypothetical protein
MLNFTYSDGIDSSLLAKNHVVVLMMVMVAGVARLTRILVTHEVRMGISESRRHHPDLGLWRQTCLNSTSVKQCFSVSSPKLDLRNASPGLAGPPCDRSRSLFTTRHLAAFHPVPHHRSTTCYPRQADTNAFL